MAVSQNKFISPQTLKSNAVGVATANTTFTTSPTNTGLLITAGLDGARVTRIIAIPLENVTANNLQLYREKAASSSKFMFANQTGGTDTVSGTDGATVIDFGYSDTNPLMLEAGEKVYVATGIAKSYNFVAEWGDY